MCTTQYQNSCPSLSNVPSPTGPHNHKSIKHPRYQVTRPPIIREARHVLFITQYARRRSPNTERFQWNSNQGVGTENPVPTYEQCALIINPKKATNYPDRQYRTQKIEIPPHTQCLIAGHKNLEHNLSSHSQRWIAHRGRKISKKLGFRSNIGAQCKSVDFLNPANCIQIS